MQIRFIGPVAAVSLCNALAAGAFLHVPLAGASRDVLPQTLDSGFASAAPYGSLDGAGGGAIGGWAYDPDSASPAEVHLYVDGSFHQILRATFFRSDLTGACPLRGGFCAFHWDYSGYRGLGRGSHSVAAYIVGVDASGVPDGVNSQTVGSPKVLSDGCQFLGSVSSGSAIWCNDGAFLNYWEPRQQNTAIVFNSSMMAGISRDIGGAITQLYRGDPGRSFHWGRNLLDEHGGSAVQVGLWGDHSGYPPCAHWAYSHVPWNPIQAIGSYCSWGGPTNDVATGCWVAAEGSTTCGSGSGSYYILHDGMSNFTVDTGPMPVDIQQWVTPQTGWIRIKYRWTSGAGSVLSPQEIPAVFTGQGINERYYSYIGSDPFNNQSVTMWGKHVSGNRYLQVRGTGPYAHEGYPGSTALGCATEGWWGVCDANDVNCVTVAGLDPSIAEGAMEEVPGGGGYITALGYFPITIGTKEVIVGLFPHKFSETPIGETRTVRQIIRDLAIMSGFNSRPVACGSRTPDQFPVPF